LKTLVGLDALVPPRQGSAVTIGTFDGVHVGHRALMAAATARARAIGALSAVVTWDRHPLVTLRPAAAPPLLTSPERRIELISEADVDLLVVLPFDDDLARTPAEQFVTRVLLEGLAARAVVVGQDWRFGHKARGDIELLRALGAELGFRAFGLDLVELGGAPASATRVRAAVGEGDMTLARTLLGRPFDLEGIVLRGDRRGTVLGYPTANLAVEDAFAHPPRGVYVGRARASGRWHAAAVNVGVNPTFGGTEESTPVRVEAHLLDFSGDLYDQVLRVEFHERLRDEEKFDSAEALVSKMAEDVDLVRAATLRARP
jgi:riboflavin kinase / FMN adenylyltransferase